MKHGCPKQPDVDDKELMNVNMWGRQEIEMYAVDLYLTCRLFENCPENSRHIRQIVTDENVQK